MPVVTKTFKLPMRNLPYQLGNIDRIPEDVSFKFE